MIGQTLNYGQPVNRQHPLCRGITAWWKVLPSWMGGGRLWDLTGKYPGTLTNGPTWAGATGRPGGMGSLRCADTQYVDVTGLADKVGGNAQLSLALWFKPNGIVANEYILDVGGLCFLLFMNGSPFNRFVLNVRDDATGGIPGILETGDNAVTDGVWQQIVIVIDGTNDAHALYVNGISKATSSTAFGVFDTGSDSHFYISDSSANALGDYDDIMLWLGRALSASEVSTLYQASLSASNPMLSWIRPVRVNQVGGGGGGVFSRLWWDMAYDYGGGVGTG